HERLDADRSGPARPRVPVRHRQGRADPRAHGQPARPPGRGAAAPDRLPDGGSRGGSRRVRAMTDATSYRTPIQYLLEHSPFYREKLGFTHAYEAGGLEAIGQLPLTEKAEIRASVTPGNPIGTHLSVDMAEVVRVYSTSGTTGTPSYIPLTTRDLENWVTGS